MVRTFLKVYMEIGSYFLFLQEQIKGIIIIIPGALSGLRPREREERVSLRERGRRKETDRQRERYKELDRECVKERREIGDR